MRSRVGGAALLLSLLLSSPVLVGCADDEPAEEPDPTTSASSSDPASASGPSSPGGGPTSPEAAATGERVDTPALSYRLPADADWTLDGDGRTAIHTDADSRTWLVSSIVETTFDGTTLDDLATATLDVREGLRPLVSRAGERTVAGVEGYVVEGAGSGGLFYEWGALLGDHYALLRFEFPEDSPQAREWVEAVLASVEPA